MTKPSPNATPPADPPPPQPTPPFVGGVAAPSWPQFRTRREEVEGSPIPNVWFLCGACRRTEIVDDATGLCLGCWRPLSMLAEVLKAIREGR